MSAIPLRSVSGENGTSIREDHSISSGLASTPSESRTNSHWPLRVRPLAPAKLRTRIAHRIGVGFGRRGRGPEDRRPICDRCRRSIRRRSGCVARQCTIGKHASAARDCRVPSRSRAPERANAGRNVTSARKLCRFATPHVCPKLDIGESTSLAGADKRHEICFTRKYRRRRPGYVATKANEWTTNTI